MDAKNAIGQARAVGEPSLLATGGCMRVVRWGAVMALALVGAGCERPTGGKSAEGAATATATATPPLPVDLSTPDRALKTIWAEQDRLNAEQCALRRRLHDSKNAVDRQAYAAIVGTPQHPEMFTGKVAAWNGSIERTVKDCVPEQFVRDINDVKTESESRAVITATVRNTTPIPADVEDPSDFQKKDRAEGIKYHYIFTKIEGQWRLEAIREESQFLGDHPVFDDARPLYPSDTHPF